MEFFHNVCKAQSVKLEELASTLDLQSVKAETTEYQNKITALETKKNDLQSLEEETSSLSEKIAGLKAQIDDEEKKSLETNPEIEDERKLKELSQKYNFHLWGGNFYFCSGYLKHCPESGVFRQGILIFIASLPNLTPKHPPL